MIVKRRIDKVSASDNWSLLKDMLAAHNVMGLATTGDDGPYSTPVFYTLADDGLTLLYMSKTSSQHSRHVDQNASVSACIFSDTNEVRLLHGVQLTGIVTSPQGREQKDMRHAYFRAYPKAKLAKFMSRQYRIYALHIETAKLTDNRLGFGTSLSWNFRPAAQIAHSR